MNRKKTYTISIVCLALVIVILALAFFASSGGGQTGEKTITVLVTHVDGTEKTFTVTTEAETLRQALENEGLLSGTEAAYGLWITTVDGYTADDSKQEWWGYTKGGEYVETGVDSTYIADGDTYEFTLNTGW